ncbi:unnamed protein product [Psylliodes chrysocephalus]|uniref:Uncharacterized protein n=1 Tax=Psylliodes chrysocephalus TaxID=3402493 RepID=A0A9P0GGR3_9CUCU|nr:unnamed protein product [Psylliodes chrysocephala]
MDAESKIKTFETFKFVCPILIWPALLSRTDVLGKKHCIEGLDNLKKYLGSQRSDDNFKIFVDSGKTLARDLGTDSKFSISKLRKQVRLFDYEGSHKPVSNSFQKFKTAFYFAILDHAISSVNERFTLLTKCYSLF